MAFSDSPTKRASCAGCTSFQSISHARQSSSFAVRNPYANPRDKTGKRGVSSVCGLMSKVLNLEGLNQTIYRFRPVLFACGGMDAKGTHLLTPALTARRFEIPVLKAVYPVQIAAAVRMRLDAQIAALCQGLHTTVDLAEGKRTGAGKRSLPQIAYARLRADFAQREQHALLSGRQLRLVRRLYIGSAHATLLRRGLACT